MIFIRSHLLFELECEIYIKKYNKAFVLSRVFSDTVLSKNVYMKLIKIFNIDTSFTNPAYINSDIEWNKVLWCMDSNVHY